LDLLTKENREVGKTGDLNYYKDWEEPPETAVQSQSKAKGQKTENQAPKKIRKKAHPKKGTKRNLPEEAPTEKRLKNWNYQKEESATEREKPPQKRNKRPSGQKKKLDRRRERRERREKVQKKWGGWQLQTGS